MARSWFVCDGDGNVIAEEKCEEDAMRRLNDSNDDSEKMEYIKCEDQSRHHVFVRIEKGKVCAVLTVVEFEKAGVKEFVDYC